MVGVCVEHPFYSEHLVESWKGSCGCVDPQAGAPLLGRVPLARRDLVQFRPSKLVSPCFSQRPRPGRPVVKERSF